MGFEVKRKYPARTEKVEKVLEKDKEYHCIYKSAQHQACIQVQIQRSNSINAAQTRSSKKEK
jgi:hypothetical protein